MDLETAAGASESGELRQLMGAVHDQHGVSLLELSERQPQLVVFLRHLGCMFCAELLITLAGAKEQLAAGGLGLVLVHMGSEDEAAARFTPFGLQDLPRISDPERRLYAAFGLKEGSWWQLLGPAVILGALRALLRGSGANRVGRNARQLGGIFLVQDGRIVKAFRQRHAGDRTALPRLKDSAPEDT